MRMYIKPQKSQTPKSSPGRRQNGGLTSTRCIGYLASIAASLLTRYYHPQVMDIDIYSSESVKPQLPRKYTYFIHSASFIRKKL